MEKRHMDALTNRLERILDAGCAHILWTELYRWYGVKKIAAGTYRDIAERWQDISDGESGLLQKVDGEGGFFLLADSKIKPFPGE